VTAGAERTTPPTLDADTALERIGEGRWRGEISERWWILQGPYGGYLSAFLVRALREAVGDARRLPRSLSAHFLAAPVAGPVEVAATVERSGGSATAVTLRMEQDGRPMVLALANAGEWREQDPAWDDARPPEVPGPEACPEVPLAGLPPFLDNFEIRWAEGEPGRARNVTWVRPRPATPLDHIAVTALADTMIPAAFTRFGRPLVVPTLDLTVHFRAPLPVEDEWALCVFESRLAAGGTWEEDGEVWSRGGRLLAHSRQLAVVREPR
jgi:acyl-CoA thioesterase